MYSWDYCSLTFITLHLSTQSYICHFFQWLQLIWFLCISFLGLCHWYIDILIYWYILRTVNKLSPVYSLHFQNYFDSDHFEDYVLISTDSNTSFSLTTTIFSTWKLIIHFYVLSNFVSMQWKEHATYGKSGGIFILEAPLVKIKHFFNIKVTCIIGNVQSICFSATKKSNKNWRICEA